MNPERPTYEELKELFDRALAQRGNNEIYWQVKGEGFAEHACMYLSNLTQSMILHRPTYDIHYIERSFVDKCYEYQQSPLTGDEKIYRLHDDGKVEVQRYRVTWEEL